MQPTRSAPQVHMTDDLSTWRLSADVADNGGLLVVYPRYGLVHSHTCWYATNTTSHIERIHMLPEQVRRLFRAYQHGNYPARDFGFCEHCTAEPA